MSITRLVQLRRLERFLAEKHAISIIDGASVTVSSMKHKWFDTSDADHIEEPLDAALKYLEFRGILKRHPISPELVRIERNK